jgi:hypothetical protein
MTGVEPGIRIDIASISQQQSFHDAFVNARQLQHVIDQHVLIDLVN